MAAALAGLAKAGNGSRSSIVLPLVVALGVGMFFVAYRRFEMFVAAIIVLRASLDAAKLSGGGGARSALDPASLLGLLFLFAAGVWLGAQIWSRRPLHAPARFLMALLALTAAGAFSAVTSRNVTGTLVDVVRLATVVALVLVLAQMVTDDRGIRFVLSAVYLSAVIPILYGIWQHHRGAGFYIGGFVRTFSTFQHPNPFAIYLSMLIIMGVAIWGRVRGWYRFGLSLILLGCGLNLFYTYTRSAWIAALLGVLVVGIIQSKRMIALMWIGVIVIALAVPSASARFQDLGTETRASGTAGNSLIWRVEYWRQALALGGDPVTGIGLGAVSTLTNQGKEPHNDFIRAFVETGVVGLAAYLWLLFEMVVLARRSVRRAAPGFPRAVAAGFAGSLAAFILLSMVSNVITQLVILLYFASLAVCAWGAGRLAPVIDPIDAEAAALAS